MLARQADSRSNKIIINCEGVDEHAISVKLSAHSPAPKLISTLNEERSAESRRKSSGADWCVASGAAIATIFSGASHSDSGFLQIVVLASRPGKELNHSENALGVDS